MLPNNTRPHIVTSANRRRFEALATVVDRTTPAFIEMAEALLEIRDRKLYQAAGFKTFEGCCNSRFHFSRQYAYRLMAAHNQHLELPAPRETTVTERTLRTRRTAVKALFQWADEMAATTDTFEWLELRTLLERLTDRFQAMKGGSPTPHAERYAAAPSSVKGR